MKASRRSRRKFLGQVLAAGGVVAGGTLLAACQPSSTGTSTTGTTIPGRVTRGGTLTVAIAGNPVSLDSGLNRSGIERQLFANLYDPLVRIDENVNPVPGLAERWETPTNRQYIFHLRRGVKFHDGTDFNAAAVKYHFEWALDPKNASASRETYAAIDTITLVDDYTIKVDLKQPFAPFLSGLADYAGMIYSPTARQKFGAETIRNPVGTGPFQLVEWVQDDHVTMKRFEGYWDKDAEGQALPYLDQLVWKPILDNTVALSGIKTNALQFVYSIEHKDVASIKLDSNLQYLYTPGMGIQDGWIQCGKGIFSNRNLRRAVAYAIDREEILRVVLHGIGQVAYGTVPPASWAFDPNFKPWKTDLTKAKEELALAGRQNGFEFTMLTQGSTQQVQKAELIQAQLAKANIKVNIQKEELGVLIDRLNKREFEFILLGQSSRLDPDTNIRRLFYSNGPFAYGGYSNPEVDRLIDQAASTLDKAERTRLYRQIDSILADDVAWVFMHFQTVNQVTRKEVMGYRLDPDAIPRFRTTWLQR